MNDDEVSSMDIRVGKTAGNFKTLAKLQSNKKTMSEKIIMAVDCHFHGKLATLIKLEYLT